MAEKKLFKGIITMDNGEQIEHFRRAVNEHQAYHMIKKKYNYDHDKEHWAYVKMEIVEVK